jgi:hypothetical protein
LKRPKPVSRSNLPVGFLQRLSQYRFAINETSRPSTMKKNGLPGRLLIEFERLMNIGIQFIKENSLLVLAFSLGVMIFFVAEFSSLPKHFSGETIVVTKCIALGLTVLFSVLNHWEKSHDKDGKITVRGKRLTSIIIFGGFVTIATMVIEEHRKTASAEAAQETTNRLLANLLRLSTRFNEIEVTLTCNFVPLDNSITNLYNGYSDQYGIGANVVGYSTTETKTGIVANAFSVDRQHIRQLIWDLPLHISLSQQGEFESWRVKGVSSPEADDLRNLLSSRTIVLGFSGIDTKQFDSFQGISEKNQITYYYSNNMAQLKSYFVLSSTNTNRLGLSSFSDLPKGDVSLFLLFKDSEDPLSARLFNKNVIASVSLKSGDFSWKFENPNAELVESFGLVIHLGTNALGNLQKQGY